MSVRNPCVIYILMTSLCHCCFGGYSISKETCATVSYLFLFSPLPVKPAGTIGFFTVCHSVRLSVLLSVRQSISQSTRCLSTRFSELFSVVLWDIDLKFSIWICVDIIQIKLDFGRVWHTFTWVIALCITFRFSPLPVKPAGTISFLAACHSVRLSFCPSVSQWVIALC